MERIKNLCKEQPLIPIMIILAFISCFAILNAAPLITNDNNITIPNVVGLSSKVAKDILNKLNIKTNLDGVGYVTAQSIPEGTPITEGMEVILTLNPKYIVE